jgi:Ser/Thr protein kinase RdoA (MazF antagonist)
MRKRDNLNYIANVYLEIKKACEHLFEFKIHHGIQLQKGWLNLKWHVETTKGSFVIKQFNPQRYPHNKLKKIEQALFYQQVIHDKGFLCPKILSIHNRFIFQTNNGERFMVMEYKRGETIAPGKVNQQQMHGAGKALGEMHRLMNQSLPYNGEKSVFEVPSKLLRVKEWEGRLEEALRTGDKEGAYWIQEQINVTNRLDLVEINNCKPGWAHRDFWVDNLLFEGDRLSSVLDFDRLDYDYPDLDIARAILSCGLDQNELDQARVSSFIDGYREEISFAKGQVAIAIRLLWYLESTWWIDVKAKRQQNGTAIRFMGEMLWVGQNEQSLSKLLEDI